MIVVSLTQIGNLKMDVIIEQTGSALGVIPLRQKPSNLSCGCRAELQTGSYGHPLYWNYFYSPSLLARSVHFLSQHLETIK